VVEPAIAVRLDKIKQSVIESIKPRFMYFSFRPGAKASHTHITSMLNK